MYSKLVEQGDGRTLQKDSPQQWIQEAGHWQSMWAPKARSCGRVQHLRSGTGEPSWHPCRTRKATWVQTPTHGFWGFAQAWGLSSLHSLEMPPHLGSSVNSSVFHCAASPVSPHFPGDSMGHSHPATHCKLRHTFCSLLTDQGSPTKPQYVVVSNENLETMLWLHQSAYSSIPTCNPLLQNISSKIFYEWISDHSSDLCNAILLKGDFEGVKLYPSENLSSGTYWIPLSLTRFGKFLHIYGILSLCLCCSRR